MPNSLQGLSYDKGRCIRMRGRHTGSYGPFDQSSTQMTLSELGLRPDEIRRLYLTHLQQMYSAEAQMFTAMPTLAIAVTLPGVKGLLLTESGQAPDRLTLLNTIFSDLGETPSGPPCMPIKALVDLSTEANIQQPRGSARDLVLIGLAMEMKHLNIAKYLMATMYARALNVPKHDQALSNVQREEAAIDNSLRFLLQDVRPMSPPS